MKNEKAKNIIIIVLIILVLTCVGYIAYPYVIKKDDAKLDTKKQEQNVVADKTTNKSENDYDAIYATVKEKYKEYTQLNWLKDDVNNKVVEMKGKYVIANKKLYAIYGGKVAEITEIKGTPKYITRKNASPTEDAIYVLTEEGEVWATIRYDIGNFKRLTDKEDQIIIDMSSYVIHNMPDIAYLTNTGDILLGENTLDETTGGIIESTDSYGIYKDGRLSYLYCDDEGKEFHTYLKDIDKEDLVIKKAIFAEDITYIITSNNKLLVADGAKVTSYKNAASKIVKDISINKVTSDETYYNITVNFTDNSKTVIKKVKFSNIDIEYFDMETKKWLDENGKDTSEEITKIEMPTNIAQNATMADIVFDIYKDINSENNNDNNTGLPIFYGEGGEQPAIFVADDGSLVNYMSTDIQNNDGTYKYISKYIVDEDNDKIKVKQIFPLSYNSEATDEDYIAITEYNSLIDLKYTDPYSAKAHYGTVGKKITDFSFKQETGKDPSLVISFTDGTKVTIDNVYKCYYDTTTKTYKDIKLK